MSVLVSIWWSFVSILLYFSTIVSCGSTNIIITASTTLEFEFVYNGNIDLSKAFDTLIIDSLPLKEGGLQINMLFCSSKIVSCLGCCVWKPTYYWRQWRHEWEVPQGSTLGPTSGSVLCIQIINFTYILVI